jgi:hypothetical protein
MLTVEHATRFAAVVLGHVTREYPHKPDQVLTGPGELQSPRTLHPIFYGSFDWHSCVHGYWLLARLLRRCPDIPQSESIRALFRTAFTPTHVSAELAYLARPYTGAFERPYGWAWLLMLAAELAKHEGDEARRWSAALAPLADAFAQRFVAYLPKATWPTRTGAHSNTAFALTLALDYAVVCRHQDLAETVTQTARRWYLGDRDCQAWEPGGEDFLSPCLMEAECMRRVLAQAEFVPWFDRFLPRLERQDPATIFEPAAVSDRTDGRIAHLDGLNLSRSWCWSSLASVMPASDQRRIVMVDAANRHLEASLHHIADHYMGEHWLATFATLALEAQDDASPPRIAA